jgi:hypothetical protein
MNDSPRVVFIEEPMGGWFAPWPSVFELSEVLSEESWVLVGGLMVQAHAMANGIDAVRPTVDLDILLDIELSSSVVMKADRAISALGYVLQEPGDVRRKQSPHYRYVRHSVIGVEKIDVMVPDHAGPTARRRLHGRPMFEVEGGTQALGRTMTCELKSISSEPTRITVPDELGALILKSAAYTADNRDRERHLQDAAVLAACMTDHATELHRLGGSDRKRLRVLAKALADPTNPAWLALSPDLRVAGVDTFRILTALK